MSDVKTAIIADTLIKFMAIASAGINMQSVVNEVRKQEEAGATPEDISEFLKTAAKTSVDKLMAQVFKD